MSIIFSPNSLPRDAPTPIELSANNRMCAIPYVGSHYFLRHFQPHNIDHRAYASSVVCASNETTATTPMREASLRLPCTPRLNTCHSRGWQDNLHTPQTWSISLLEKKKPINPTHVFIHPPFHTLSRFDQCTRILMINRHTFCRASLIQPNATTKRKNKPIPNRSVLSAKPGSHCPTVHKERARADARTHALL